MEYSLVNLTKVDRGFCGQGIKGASNNCISMPRKIIQRKTLLFEACSM